MTLIGDIDPAGDVCSSTRAQVLMTARTSATCSTPRTFPGALRRRFQPANHQRQRHAPAARAAPSARSPAALTATMSRITSGSSTTPRRPTRPTHVRPRSRRSATPMVPGTRRSIRPTMPMISTTSPPRSDPAISRRFPSSRCHPIQDGHPGNSNPLDEQAGLVNLINFLQQAAGLGLDRCDRRLRRLGRLVRPRFAPIDAAGRSRPRTC